ncbi:hypothetical protein TH63_14940 [Rufibacter radiotolerans]|uniref:Xylose isomerase-like TIM barrel domain-containing protein n=1 Tax=Rufibacter radiotolerans TaxID=1379910 RepID=A0A0H4VRS4_9BACT|nr:sugar phosphate isomerase/epimerase [Rufibacter radiotolerans]AKQ46627.1 hypothetical protein TH63_14940 [Rufibacter radiotolerans]
MNKRRLFLQQLGLLSVGLGMAPTLLAQALNEQPSGELNSPEGKAAAAASITSVGLQLYTLREFIQKDVKGVIKKVAKADYQDVETYGYSVKNGYWGVKPKAFAELLKDNDLVSSSGHYDFEEYITKGDTEVIKQYIEAATTLGQTYLTVPFLAKRLRSKADDYRSLAEKLNKAAEICQSANLKLAYHNHDFELASYGKTTGLEILLKETSPALVDFEADLYWVARAGKKATDLFKEHPGRFTMWHVKDMDKNSPNLNTEIGSGSIDYKAIFKEARQAGLKHVFVEQENFAAFMDPFKSIAQSRDYVKKTLLRHT